MTHLVRQMHQQSPVKKPSGASTGVLLAMGAAVLFAVNGSVSKVAMLNGLSSLELVSVRSAGTAAILLGITAVRRPAVLRVSRTELRFLVLFGVTGIAMAQWLYFVAIQRMPVGIAILFVYTAPLMVAVWARFVQKQPARPGLWPGMLCAMGGLAVVAQLWKGMTLDPIGLVSAVAGGAALACYYVMGEHGQRVREPISLMGLSFGISAILWAIVSPWWTFPFARLAQPVELPGALPGSAPLWLMVLWIVVLGSVVPFLFVLLAVARVEPARVGLICMLEPIAAGIVAWILLGESLSATAVAGSCIVLLGIVVTESPRRAANPRTRRLTSRSAPPAIRRRTLRLPQMTNARSMPSLRALGHRPSPTRPQSSRPSPGTSPERRPRAIHLTRRFRRDHRERRGRGTLDRQTSSTPEH